MKKSFILSTIFIISTLLSFRVYAQSSTDPFQQDQAPVIQDVEGLRAEFKQYTQDPETKQVKFEMILKSGIDSDRVKITWTLIGASTFVDSNKATLNAKVESGKSYTIPITIIPNGYGVTELRAKAEAFKAENSYLVSIRKNFASNSSQEILPITAEYNQAKVISIVKNIFIIITLFIFLVLGAMFGFKRFVRWLNRDDRK